MTDWVAEIEHQCPWAMSWASGVGDAPLRARFHHAWALWVWDDVVQSLPDGASVVSLRYAGRAGCGHESCPADDCTTSWEVIDAGGSSHRVDVPI